MQQENNIAVILQQLQISSLNEMQRKVLEVDEVVDQIILLSPTGSGKTLAFLLPLVFGLKDELRQVQALILVPSRELGLQVEKVVREMRFGSKVNCCYGGHSMLTEVRNLSEPPAILIGTPGRIADHIRRKTFRTDRIFHLVLDEFDKSLEMGFKTEMEFILGELKNVKKRMLTSATMLAEIPDFTGIQSPKIISFLKDQVSERLSLKVIRAIGKDKLDVLFRLLCSFEDQSSLVFCNHRDAVERISELLRQRNILHGIFHGGMDQDERERSLLKFRNGSHYLLITTDLASRGLDIAKIKNIVHYQLPTQAKVFIHRNGRTARVEASGSAYLVLSESETVPSFIEEVPEVIELPEEIKLPNPPQWETLYFSAGKKDKVNKTDIVGMLLKKGGIDKDDLGLIDILDKSAYAAVKRDKISRLLQKIKGESLKKQKVKIAIAY